MIKWLSGLFDTSWLDPVGNFDFGPEPGPIDEKLWPHWPKGSLPHSRRIAEAALFRYQPKRYLEAPETWYRMVWDADYKWKSQSRFSGAGLSSGHYFALTPSGADAEMAAYKANKDDYELLRLNVAIDRILDLTNFDTLTWFYKKHFRPERDWHWAIILDSLFEQQLGGDSHTDFAGHRALLDGYNGIAFFSARTSGRHWLEPGRFVRRDLDLIGYTHEAMLADLDCINVVIYFGHNIVRSTRTIEVRGKTFANRLFGASNSEIDKVFSDDPARPPGMDLTFDALQARTERFAWATYPRIVEESFSELEKRRKAGLPASS